MGAQGYAEFTDELLRNAAEAFGVSYDQLLAPWPPCQGRLHFVRFKDDRYWNAVKTFGRPDFVHRFWDHRAVAEVMPGDTVVFAEGDEHQAVVTHSYDDSAFF